MAPGGTIQSVFKSHMGLADPFPKFSAVWGLHSGGGDSPGPVLTGSLTHRGNLAALR